MAIIFLNSLSLNASCISAYSKEINRLESWSSESTVERRDAALWGLVLTGGVVSLAVGIESAVEKIIRKVMVRKYKQARKVILEARIGGGKLVSKLAKKALRTPDETTRLIKLGDDNEVFCSRWQGYGVDRDFREVDEWQILYDYNDIKNALKYGGLLEEFMPHALETKGPVRNKLSGRESTKSQSEVDLPYPTSDRHYPQPSAPGYSW
jgi:hypothetical protein